MEKRSGYFSKKKYIIIIHIIIMIFELFYLNYIFFDPLPTDNNKTEDINQEDIIDEKENEPLNGSATARFNIPSTSHSSYPMYHTIYLYDDLTCEVGDNKQLSESSYSWAPNDPNAKWNYMTDYFFGSCNYIITNSDSYDYVMLLYSFGESADNQTKSSVLYRIERDENGQVYYLQTILPDESRKYYYKYEDDENFASQEKEQIKKANEELVTEKEKFIGSWIKDYQEMVLNEDGTCMITYTQDDSKYVTNCTWWPRMGENAIYLSYIDHIYNSESEMNRIYLLSDDSSTLINRIDESDSYNRK